MGNGIFGKWFREFATLVLTQTVQAFLLAIVMAIIVSCISNNSGGPSTDTNNAAGLLAIIALASFNKIELLVKNIFGVTSQFAPTLGEGAKGLAGAALAYRGIKNVSDNISKAREGIRLKKQGEAGLRSLNANNGLNPDGTSPLNTDTLNNKSGDNKDNINEQTQSQIEEQVLKLETMGDIGALTSAIENLTKATETGNKNDTQSKMKEYQDMINKGNDLKRSAIRENVGATLGAGAGIIHGLAKGEGVVQDALAGAGFGDSIGKYTADEKSKKEAYIRKMGQIADAEMANKQKADEEVKKFMKQASENVASGKVEDVSSYNRAITDAVKSYRTNIKNNTSNSLQGAKNQNRDARKKMNDLKKLHNQIDKNSNAGL